MNSSGYQLQLPYNLYRYVYAKMIITIISILLQVTTLGLNIGLIYIFVRHEKTNKFGNILACYIFKQQAATRNYFNVLSMKHPHVLQFSFYESC